MSLDRYTWDQAVILGLATANGFRAFGIKPSTVRKWASRGQVTAVGKAPGGAHLYQISSVARRAEGGTCPQTSAMSHFDADGRPMPTGRSSFVIPEG